jgi:carbon monoxide dehydrogenase subunit G
MKLEHEFTVPAPIEEAWQVLLDVEKIAPCMPGATLTSVDGDDFTGTVKVKVGPIQVTYKGQAKFVEKHDDEHRIIIEASGKEARGSGTASATVTANLTAQGATTRAHVVTDLNVTGRPAQFGRGVMADVGAKLIGQFSDCLAQELAGGGAGETTTVAEPTTTAANGAQPVETGATAPLPPTSSATPEAAPAPATPLPPRPTPVAPRREAEPIDLLDLAGGSVAKRLAPVAIVLIVLFLLIRRRRNR